MSGHKRGRARFSRLSRRGSAVVDYLLMTAAVAGIAVPIVLHYFGEPILNTLGNQRQGLVSFIAQNKPRPKVPPEWFRIERQGNVGNGGPNVTQQNITVPPPTTVPNVGSPGLPPPPNVTVGGSGAAGNPSVGGANGPNGAGGAGGAGGGGGNGIGAGNRGGGAGDDGDSNFFGGGGKQDKEAPESGGFSGGPTYGRSAGGGFGDGGGEDEVNDFAAKAPRSAKQETEKQKKEGGDTAKRANDAELVKAQERIEARNHEFDWWLLLKIIILILIGFFLIIIALSNARKS